MIAPEARCSPYDRGDYAYPASVEAEIVALLGGIWSPYTGERFASDRETDIEHMVALSEAHDSGACTWSIERRRAFARDLDNLTLADPDTNRRDKGALDAADWLPPRSRCWFAARVLAVRLEWMLSIDRREAASLESVLSRCSASSQRQPDPPLP
ncbi:HNH endonuclease family protein [Candidatus Palauibacter sp.]|uniref:HNH endonuclease family protein n=1 Tax=Candidatus Palauibacter sp. TaxID=3101350 RepID=UPI003B5162E7